MDEGRKRAHGSWSAMRDRCLDPKHEAYHRYAGRGITICERWLQSFENFLEDMGPRPFEMTLERIDNSKGYYKENCKWATYYEQGRNRRGNRLIEVNGAIKPLSEWCEIYNINRCAVDKRFKYGWTGEKVFTEPVRKYGRFTIGDVTKSLRLWCIEYGFSFSSVRGKLAQGRATFDEIFIGPNKIAKPKFQRPWKEEFVDHMGLVVALSGNRRFSELKKLKERIDALPDNQREEIKQAIRQRFTPTNGTDGCCGAMAAVKEAA